MKLSEKWLREWVNPHISREALSHQLTMAGLSVESCELFENDALLEFEITPNRADCLSVMGMAREIAVITDSHMNESLYKTTPLKTHFNSSVKIYNDAPEACPRYTGRAIKNLIDLNTASSRLQEIQQKLHKCGLKIIHPIVDVMNYVMLELGQPLHAFDLSYFKNNEIHIRWSKNHEKLTLLDQKEVTLSEQDPVLIIANEQEPLALAGIMGGLTSSVSEKTSAIFIESAFFTPQSLSGRARKFGLHTEASHRFERGVDPLLPQIALERATALLIELYPHCQIGDIIADSSDKYLPVLPKIKLSFSSVNKLLGILISPQKIEEILGKLKFEFYEKTPDALVVKASSYRFDIQGESDLIEEIARIYGYDNIADRSPLKPFNFNAAHTEQNTRTRYYSDNKLDHYKNILTSQGYQEVITYSFISENDWKNFEPYQEPLYLSNPLSSEFAVMRSTLWPSLLQVVKHHSHRQYDYLRFFEQGLKFSQTAQESVLSGILAGNAAQEQWGEKKRPVDFYDVKNTLEQLLADFPMQDFSFHPAEHPALHPSLSAQIRHKETIIGYCGELHPKLAQIYEIKMPVYVFEISLALLNTDLSRKTYTPYSKYPAIRRDIALIVNAGICADELRAVIRESSSDILQDICLFDVYQNKALLQQGQKSIALGLIFQHAEKTLEEEEVQLAVQNIMSKLKSTCGATLREQ